jgi:AraC-like DNA-binding protein
MNDLGPYAAEHIGYRRSAAIVGLEILDAYHCPREWRIVADDYAITFLHTWRGQVTYRGRVNAVEPGIAFCNYPGEALIATPEANLAGSFNVLLVDEELMRQWVTEYQLRARRPEWRAIYPRIPDEVRTRFQTVSGSLTAPTSAIELQSASAELSEALVRGMVAGVSDRAPSPGPAIRGTARMRECLHEAGFDVDLETLAQTAGMSKFQALRAFKRRYGLPPHEYQMCLRIALARRSLLAGVSQAEVAAHCGFVDQSHMIRHFKRIVGVTPMRYVGSRSRGGLDDSARRALHHASSLVERADWQRS